jgi:hypothetical protein
VVYVGECMATLRGSDASSDAADADQQARDAVPDRVTSLDSSPPVVADASLEDATDVKAADRAETR